MEQEKLHILITGEQGKGHSFVVSRTAARRAVIAAISLLLVLLSCSIVGFTFLSENLSLASNNKQLNTQLKETMAALDQLQAGRQELISSYEENITRLEEERADMLEGSINRLDEKSKIIEQVIDHIGIEVKVEEDPGHSGGPFLALNENYGDRLILKADRYLEVLNSIPLGRPVPGAISSKYGRRSDPLNQEMAFHPGIDFRGHTGDPVKATADAVVKASAYSGDLGKYIVLSHGNGYETIFAHLNKRLAKEGETVKRGQTIGQIGNTGRSTGSHLHYAIRYGEKSIDPLKYIQVANLSLRVTNK